MWMDILAMIAAGAGVAGIFMALRRFSRDRMPKWSVPAAIGAAMLIFSIWNEYSWYPRVTGVLPETVVVLPAAPERVFYRPWTYVFPLHSQFSALDKTVMTISADNPSLRRAEIMEVRRWTATRRFPVTFDCAAGRRVIESGDGQMLPSEGVNDALQQAACQEG
jgi:hypothetical protein